MANKTIYVGPRHLGVYQQAQVAAEAAGISVSSLIIRALWEYLARAEATAMDDPPPAVSMEQRIDALEAWAADRGYSGVLRD